MIGKRPDNPSLFDVGNVWKLELDPAGFHSQLSAVAPQLFRDEEFAKLYCANNGRPSVAPSLLALLVILQTHARVSDAEAIERTAFDLRWAAVLGRHAGSPLCAKSTLQLFRHHLILHEEFRILLQRSIERAKEAGLIKGRELSVALDTKPMLGAGAVQDTYNLLTQGMRQLVVAISRESRTPQNEFLATHSLEILNAPSIKGSVDIDWSDEKARNVFLTGLVGQARKLLALADGNNTEVRKSAELLEKLLVQDIQCTTPKDGGENSADVSGSLVSDCASAATIVRGTAPGRIPSATDPTQRHGRKSRNKTFTGHKSEIVVDTASGVILHADILPGDAADDTDALKHVEAAQEMAMSIGATIVDTTGDCAYGSRATRQEFADAGKVLIARVPQEGGNKGLFTKGSFQLTMVSGQVVAVTCPGGHTTDLCSENKDGTTTFYFDQHCPGCPLRSKCTTSAQGRSLSVHAQEEMMQTARAFQNSPEGRRKLRERLSVENSLGRLAHYEIGQARYVGHDKSRFQLLSACCVANLRRSWNFMQRAANSKNTVVPVDTSMLAVAMIAA